MHRGGKRGGQYQGDMRDLLCSCLPTFLGQHRDEIVSTYHVLPLLPISYSEIEAIQLVPYPLKTVTVVERK